MASNLLTEIWEKRSLVMLLAFNDVKLRYRNSILGFFWSFLEPLLMLTVLYFVFSLIFKSAIENYPLYLLLGLILWFMFVRSTSAGLTSLINRSDIIQHVYLRRELIVISACLAAFIMMSFEFIVFAIFLIGLQFIPPVTVLILPLIVINLLFLSIGISLFLGVLNVYYRDIQFIWQVAIQAGFFLSPILYTIDMIPEEFHWILMINPMVPIIESAHNAVLYGSLPSMESVFYMTASTISVLIIGLLVFKKKNSRLVERL